VKKPDAFSLCPRYGLGGSVRPSSARGKIADPGARGEVLDGHTRLLAAQAAGIEDVPVAWKSFASEDAAVAYAIHCQRDRRNLTGADILRWVGELDRRKQRGGDHKSVEAKSKASSDAFDPKSAQTVAETIGTSTRKVEKARAILDRSGSVLARVGGKRA